MGGVMAIVDGEKGKKKKAKRKQVQLWCSWFSKPSVLPRHGLHLKRIKVLLCQSQPMAQGGRHRNHVDVSPLSLAHQQNSFGRSSPFRGVWVWVCGEKGSLAAHPGAQPPPCTPSCAASPQEGAAIPSWVCVSCTWPSFTHFLSLEAGFHGKVQISPLPSFKMSAIA